MYSEDWAFKSGAQPTVFRAKEREPHCARCGHSLAAHGGHTHPPGAPEPTHCSQGCPCVGFALAADALPEVGGGERMTPEQCATAAVETAWGGRRDQDWADDGLCATVASAIRAAVAEEREACAREADPRGLSHLFPASPGRRERQSLVAEVSRRIAAAIRARGKTATAD